MAEQTTPSTESGLDLLCRMAIGLLELARVEGMPNETRRSLREEAADVAERIARIEALASHRDANRITANATQHPGALVALVDRLAAAGWHWRTLPPNLGSELWCVFATKNADTNAPETARGMGATWAEAMQGLAEKVGA